MNDSADTAAQQPSLQPQANEYGAKMKPQPDPVPRKVGFHVSRRLFEASDATVRWAFAYSAAFIGLWILSRTTKENFFDVVFFHDRQLEIGFQRLGWITIVYVFARLGFAHHRE